MVMEDNRTNMNSPENPETEGIETKTDNYDMTEIKSDAGTPEGDEDMKIFEPQRGREETDQSQAFDRFASGIENTMAQPVNNTEKSKAGNEDRSVNAEQEAVADRSMNAGQDTNADLGQNIRIYPVYGAQNAQQAAGAGFGAASTKDFVRTADTEIGRPKKKSTAKKVLTIAAAALLFGIIASATFIGVNKLYNAMVPESNNREALDISIGKNGVKLNLDDVDDDSLELSTTPSFNNVQGGASDVSAIVEKAMPSIVIIDSTFVTNSYFGQYESTGGGSGIIIGKTDKELLIATNNHVVEDAKTIEVTLNDSTKYSATVKGRDSDADLAVISVALEDIPAESLNAISVAKLGDSDKVKVGQMAIAIGNALGYGQSTTVGYISATNREVTVDSGKTMVLLQTDAAINPGNSGGALLNLDGEVIGINSVKYASAEVEGMGFAIPISRAQSILDELKVREVLAEDEQGYLGVTVKTISAEEAEEFNMPQGVKITAVNEGYAADLAGLKMGDVIVSVNDRDVSTTDSLKEYVNAQRIGTSVKVTVKRLINGEYVDMSFDVVLTKNPSLDEKKDSEDSSKPDGEQPGITLPDNGMNGEKQPFPGEGEAPDGSVPDGGDAPDDFGGDNYYYDGDLGELPDDIRDFLENWGFFGP